MRILGLDISTNTGWAIIEDGKLVEYGLLEVEVEDFNVNDKPDKSSKYPFNIIKAADKMGDLILELVKKKDPDLIVAENTVKGRNRHTQRLLEWIHLSTLHRIDMVYRDPSWWRSILNVRLTNDDKKNNKLVSQGKKRGRITRKHLSVRQVNAIFGTTLKLKDNDIADAICLALAYYKDSTNKK